MTCVSTTLGLFPLPDDAKERLSDLKGHQKGDLVDGDEDEAVTAVYDEARADLLARQADAGLDYAVEGQARWDDMLAHPLAVHDAVETRGIVRYYDNNNFYREPVVVGDLGFDGDLARDLDAAAATAGDLQAVVPGPYSLADLATDEHYGDEAAFLAAVAEFLAGEVEAFPAEVELVSLLEPSLSANPPGGDLDERAGEAVDAVAAATDAEVAVHTYWGAPPERTYAHLLDARVDAVGFDLVTAHDEAAHLASEFGTTDDVALGVVDGQNTLVESPETVRDRLAWFEERLPPAADLDAVYLTPNTGLFYLPVGRFEAKLEALARGAALADAEVTA